MLKVGIISANWGAYAHLPAWRAVPGVEVVGICTSRQETAEKASAQLGIPRAFWDAAAMAADPDIDIVDVGTRPTLREDMVLECLRHRKHVYAGIPQAAGIDGARSMYNAWRQSGVTAIVDAYSEWLPAHRLAKEMLDEGYLGRPFGGTCLFNMSLFNQLQPDFPYNWFAQAGQGVSSVRNMGSHALHMLVHLFGEVEEVVAHDTRLLDEWRSIDGKTVIKAETNDFADMLLRFSSGMTLQFQVCWNAPAGQGWYLDVFGSAGRIVAQGPMFPTPRETTLHAGKLGEPGVRAVSIPERLFKDPRVAIDADASVAPAYGMALAMHSMVEEIGGRGRARPDFEQAWQVERIQEAVRRSSSERRWVRIDEIASPSA
ncbi:MAG TPA: Gfo/Idh/MocA family oxidoreductase [Sphingobium sp.]|uniref:Gfo/Idh/MocA family protein n=1 Tax=Sphingobium sp. TaxID=1912891 RepID=UPI002ECFBAF2